MIKLNKFFNEIFTNPTVIMPNDKLKPNDNKNIILKCIAFIIMILIALRVNGKIIINLLIAFIFVHIIGSKIIESKKKFNQYDQYNQYDQFNQSNQFKWFNKKSQHQCRKSTIDNPMGNVLLYTPISEQNDELCPTDSKTINDNLTYNIYYDSKDLFKTEENIRSFYTMPSQTNPNNIDKFKSYLYNLDNPTCKIDQINCMYNEDIKYHKTNFYDKN